VKFIMPDPPQPYCPFAINAKPHVELVANGSCLQVIYEGPDTPMHESAAQQQACVAWNIWDMPNWAMLWPPLSYGGVYQGSVIRSRWFV
jgi:hypothetical protein